MIIVAFFAQIILSIRLNRADWDNSAWLPLIESEWMNIMLVGTEKSGDYEFIEYLAVLGINSTTGELKLLNINPNFSTGVLVNKGQTRFYNLLSLAKLENKDQLEVLVEGVETTFGLNLDRYLAMEVHNLQKILSDLKPTIEVGGKKFEGVNIVSHLADNSGGEDASMKRQIDIIKQSLNAGDKFINLIRFLSSSADYYPMVGTNLKTEEFLKLANLFLSNGSNRLSSTYLSINNTYLVKDSTGQYYQPVAFDVDREVRNIYLRTDLIKEQAKIEIYNATTISGYARRYQRLIENLGGNVVRTGNSTDSYIRNTLYVSDPVKFANNIAAIKELLRGELIITTETYPYNHVGDIVLVLAK